MTDEQSATDKFLLPGGVGILSGLITTGTSIFGWDPDRDGIPEVVTCAHQRFGSDGLIAIARLAYDQEPVPTFGDAERLVEWGIGHYWGSTVCQGDLQPEWDAKGELMRSCYAEGITRATSELGWGVPWVESVDWRDAALRAEQAGAVVFTERVTRCSGTDDVAEVDMFVHDGDDWREDPDETTIGKDSR